MKKYSFRLQRVLDVRRIQAESTRAALLAARVTQAGAEARLGELRDVAASAPAPAGQLPDVQTAVLTRTLRSQAVALAATDLHVAREAVVERIEEHRAAKTRVEALERLDDRHREAWSLEDRREEHRVLDDLATTRATRTHDDDER